MSCGVCTKHISIANLPGGVIFQNALVFIAHFPSVKSPHYGHLILELRRHITGPAQMTEPEAAEVGIWLQRISTFLESELGAEHTYLFRIGDITPHLHFHAVPRFSGVPREMWGIYLFENPQGRKADAGEVKMISDRMRDWISQKEFK